MSMKKLEAQINIIRSGLAGIVQRLDDIEKAYTEMPTQAKAEIELSPDQLDKWPWRAYREGHRSAWIFADTEGAEKLVELIRESPEGKVPIGEFEYKITKGRDREFISRNPIK